jgi:hypothetical protein
MTTKELKANEVFFNKVLLMTSGIYIWADKGHIYDLSSGKFASSVQGCNDMKGITPSSFWNKIITN